MIVIIIMGCCGAAIGFAVGFVIGLGAEFLSCISCGSCGVSDATPLLVYFAIIGAVMGLIYGFYVMKADAREEAAKRKAQLDTEAKMQRIKLADEVTRKAIRVDETCAKNKMNNKPLVFTEYKASAQMTAIVHEMEKLSEKQGKVDALAEELTNRDVDSV